MKSETETELVQEIEAVMESLELLRAQLSRPKQDAATGLAVPQVPVRAVQQLKNTVDQFRLFLWAYLDTWALSGTDPLGRMRAIRTDCAIDLLGRLLSDFQAGGAPTGTEAQVLRERLEVIHSLLS